MNEKKMTNHSAGGCLMIRVMILLMCLALVLPNLSFAKETRTERDTDNDGVIDRITITDENGNVKRMEIDKDADGAIDTIQYYQAGTLTRVERDTDGDHKMDVRDYFTKENRIRQEKSIRPGRLLTSFILMIKGR